MTILGIDPGFDRCGWAVLSAQGTRQRLIAGDCITPPKSSENETRFRYLYQELALLFHTHHPDVVALESLFFSRNVTTALPVSEVRGMILALAFAADLPVHHYRPDQIKMTVTGHGRADKGQVARMTARLLGLEKIPKIDDTVDAIAVALTHAACAANRLA